MEVTWSEHQCLPTGLSSARKGASGGPVQGLEGGLPGPGVSAEGQQALSPDVSAPKSD